MEPGRFVSTNFGCVRGTPWEGELRVEHDFRSLIRASSSWGDDERARLHGLAPKIVSKRFATIQPERAVPKKKKKEKKSSTQ